MQESGEMYLKTILILSKSNDQVRSVDIANELNFSRASVSRAVGILKEDEYIVVDPKGYISLTAKGQDLASYTYEKHQILKAFLMEVADVSAEVAHEDACRIEHVISDETFESLKRILEAKK